MSDPAEKREPIFGDGSKVFFLISSLIVLGIAVHQNQSDGEDILTIDDGAKRSSIDEFPEDFFSPEQRRSGWIVVHFVATAHFCFALALICDQFFVPALERIAEALNVPVDVAGATFMAIGTSSPELYSAVIGSFVTHGDIGIGTIVGSAVFNILGVTSVTGILLGDQECAVDWYPICRDSLVYIFSVVALIGVIQDNVVTCMESLLLLLMFAVYIAVMYFNSTIKEWGEGTVEDIHRWWHKSRKARASSVKRTLSTRAIRLGDPRLIPSSDAADSAQVPDDKIVEEDDDSWSPWTIPEASIEAVAWLLLWPWLMAFACTVPDCRKGGHYILTFMSSVVWIGIISYLCSWMVTIISDTFDLPDSVAGITILAAGISVPEIIASIIVVRSGLANMALCNLLGSNILDILFCLGLPWCLKTAHSGRGVVIHSHALPSTALALLTTVVLFVVCLAVAGWRLNRRVGIACACLYATFLVVAYKGEMAAL